MAKSNGIDLSKLSIEELENLVRDAQAEIVSRKEAEKQRVLDQIRELAASIGTTPEELLRQQAGGRGRGAKVEAKYRHPDDPSQTWSGRGKRPQWVNDALAAGKSLEDLAVE
jgi:DNA-binding protein H-NS